jgi:hypothetical protein
MLSKKCFYKYTLYLDVLNLLFYCYMDSCLWMFSVVPAWSTNHHHLHSKLDDVQSTALQNYVYLT